MSSLSAPVGSSSQQARFVRDGFLLLPGVCANLVPHLRDGVDAGVVIMAEDLGVPRGYYSRLVSAWGLGNETVQALLGRVSERLGAAASTIGCIEPRLVDATLFLKTPSAPEGTHAHQDASYRWSRPPADRYALTTWLAIDECDGETGALSLLPGSHRGPVEVRQDYLGLDFRDRAKSEEWRRRAITVAAHPGDVVVFDARTWHAAAPFRSVGGVRGALAVRWSCAATEDTACELPRPEIVPTRFGMDTAGQVLVSAIARACPEFVPDVESGSVRRAVTWLLALRDREPVGLSDAAWRALADLELALTALERHRGRPNAGVWRRVRDEVLAGLARCSGVGAGRGGDE